MGILQRFSDIVSANVNALLDKAEDPGKMIDEYLRKATKDLAEVKQETAGVMAEESRTKRLVDDNAAQVAKYEALAKKALLAGNEDDARVFLSKKQELESAGAGLQTAYAAAHENAVKMRSTAAGRRSRPKWPSPRRRSASTRWGPRRISCRAVWARLSGWKRKPTGCWTRPMR